MKQVLIGQGGEVGVFEVPSPTISAVEVLIASEYSLISTGTEATVRRTAQAPIKLAQEALTDGSLRAKGIDRVRTRGLRAALKEAQSRASRTQVVGYSAAGRVLAFGERVSHLSVGQRVTAAGAGYANHAERIAVPRSLVCPIPDNVSTQDAAYETVAAVALHAFRLSAASLGESIAESVRAAELQADGCDPAPVGCGRGLGEETRPSTDGQTTVPLTPPRPANPPSDLQNQTRKPREAWLSAVSCRTALKHGPARSVAGVSPVV